jgi:hypothetical protein
LYKVEDKTKNDYNKKGTGLKMLIKTTEMHNIIVCSMHTRETKTR